MIRNAEGIPLPWFMPLRFQITTAYHFYKVLLEYSPMCILDSFIETCISLQVINLLNHQIYNFHSHIYITKYFMEQFS